MAGSKRRVVVTGLGALTAAGWGVSALREAARAGRSTIGPFDRFDHAADRTHVAAQVHSEVPDLAAKRARWARLSNSDRFALAAAYEAVDHAGLPVPLAASVGVFIGSTTGGLFETESFFRAVMQDNASRPARSPLAAHLYSSPAELIARRLGVTGPVETVCSACASGGLAIERALRAVRSGEVDLALAGGTDALCRTTYSGFNALRAVDTAPCQPFRRARAGLSLGEGGAVLVLESFEFASARGASPLAEVLGAGSSCDASHMTAPHPEGTGASAAIHAALRDAHLDGDAIDFVSAHGTGTPRNDQAEWRALANVFGSRARHLPIEISKAIVGHLLGAAGAVQAVSTILQMIDCEVYPAPAAGELDPGAPARLVFGEPLSLRSVRAALSVSLGFGGANVATIFGRLGET